MGLEGGRGLGVGAGLILLHVEVAHQDNGPGVGTRHVVEVHSWLLCSMEVNMKPSRESLAGRRTSLLGICCSGHASRLTQNHQRVPF